MAEWQKFNIRDEPWLNQFWQVLPKFKALESTVPLPVLTLDQIIRIEAEKHDVLSINETAALAQEGFKRGLWPTSDEFIVVNPTTGKNYTCQRFRKMGTKEVHVLYCVTGNWQRIYSTIYIN